MNCRISATLPLALTLGVFREIPGRDKPMFVKALVLRREPHDTTELSAPLGIGSCGVSI